MKTFPMLVSGFILFGAAQAYAIPTSTNKCKNIPQVKHPDNGSNVMYDETCKTAYVMPPVNGVAELKALAQNANLQFCPAALKAGKTADSLANSGVLIAQRLEKMVSEYDPLRQQLTEVETQLIAADADVSRLTAEIEYHNGKKIELIGEYQGVKSDLESCQLFGNDCADLIARKKELETAILATKKLQDAAQLAKISADSKASQLRGQKNRMETDLTNATSNLLALLGQLDTVNTTIMNTYKTWASLEAATGQMVYTIKWKDLVNKYAQLNPAFADKGINFTPVSIADGRFFATLKLKAGDNASSVLPGILSATVPGVRPYGVNELGAPGSIQPIPANITDAATAAATPNLAQPLTNYDISAGGVNSVSGQIQLSLMGACPYFPEGLNPGKTSVSPQDLAAYLIVNANLAYDVKVTRKYKASFNMTKLVEQIEQVSSKKKWFFKTEDLHKITFNSNASSWFDITFDPEDDDHNFTKEEQDAITKDVKADLVKRATDQIAVVTAVAPGVPAPGQSGYEKNPKVPCTEWYCKAMTFALGVAEGFFGSKNAVSEFKVKNNSWTTDNVIQNKVIRKQHILTFVPNENQI